MTWNRSSSERSKGVVVRVSANGNNCIHILLTLFPDFDPANRIQEQDDSAAFDFAPVSLCLRLSSELCDRRGQETKPID